MRTRSPWPGSWWLAAGSAALFVVLTALVVTDTTHAVDSWGIRELRPGLVWGSGQVWLAPWMTRLEPVRMYALLAVVAVVLSVRRRSWWPLAFAAAITAVSSVLAVVLKNLVHRGDPVGYVPPTGGSYPSGHMIAIVVALGGCLLLLFRRVPWWLWLLVAAAAGCLALTMLVIAAHWPSDALGGVLLGVAVVAAMSRTPLRQRAHDSPDRRPAAAEASRSDAG